MMNENGGRVYVKDLLEPIMTLVGDMGEIKGSVKGIETNLQRVDDDFKKHLEECKMSNSKKGKLTLFHKIMIVIAIIGILGGGTLLKTLWDEVDRIVDKTEQVSKSE